MRWSRRQPVRAELAHSVEGLGVWVEWSPQRPLRFFAQHVMRGESSPFGGDVELEYFIDLTADETQRLTAALGVAHPRDLVPAIAERGPEVVKRGELDWVRDLLGEHAGEYFQMLRDL
jgi:hypothetical protein